MLLASEVGSRAVWTRARRLSLWDPLEYVYYPELKPVDGARDDSAAVALDVLLLGGSTVNPMYGDVGSKLARELRLRTGAEVRVHNVAMPAHSSLDSRYKCSYLKRKRFDVVAVYHAINELRANNCPPEVFHRDYSHYSWYATVNAFESHREVDVVTLPWTLHYLFLEAAQRLYPSPRVPVSPELRHAWTTYGGDVKTAPSFHDNLRAILELARSKEEPVVLMSFAYYLAEGYTYERFQAGRLDYGYGSYSYPIETWGQPAHVIKGLQLHNEVIRRLAGQYRTIYVDQNAAIPKDGRFFKDVCHLSARGVEFFAARLADGLDRVGLLGRFAKRTDARPEARQGGLRRR